MLDKVGGAKGADDISKNIKLESNKDITDFLKSFGSYGEAKGAILAVLSEIQSSDPKLAAKLEKILGALDKAEKQGVPFGEFANSPEKQMGNDMAATQGAAPVQEVAAATNDNTGSVNQKVDGLGAIV